MESLFKLVASWIAYTVELVAALVIAAGSLQALWATSVRVSGRGQREAEGLEGIRLRLGRWLVPALESSWRLAWNDPARFDGPSDM